MLVQVAIIALLGRCVAFHIQNERICDLSSQQMRREMTQLLDGDGCDGQMLKDDPNGKVSECSEMCSLADLKFVPRFRYESSNGNKLVRYDQHFKGIVALAFASRALHTGLRVWNGHITDQRLYDSVAGEVRKQVPKRISQQILLISIDSSLRRATSSTT